ncbi:MAG: phosphoribosylamine--glycine ligase [Candidatus Bathyarchaeia archaeon]
MKVLLVGEGAREHSIADALFRSTHEPRLFAASALRNPGIHRLCRESGGEMAIGNSKDPMFVADVAEKYSVDFTFVGPEEPLFAGVADELERRGIACVGAKRAAAEVEMSKAFMRRLMWRHHIPGRLRFRAFTDVEDALAYISEYAESLALKPARQAGGKGVKVIADIQAYLGEEKAHVKSVHTRRIDEVFMAGYTDIEDRILLEERVEGPEYTLQMFTDGRTVKPLPLVQDNKNAHEMDIGPETGGMGSISGKDGVLPFITQEEYATSVDIVRQVVRALEKDTGVRYKGIIAGQMMLTAGFGPTIIEFYSRLGDPEAVNVLPLMDTDMVDVSEAIINEKLHKIDLSFQNLATVVKCVAPIGYPTNRKMASGHVAQIDEGAVVNRGCQLFYGSLDLQPDGGMITGGSRICEIFAAAETIQEASEMAERSMPSVKLLNWNVYHRSDIGTETLLNRRTELADLVRGVYTYRREKGLVGVTIDWIPGRGKITYEA